MSRNRNYALCILAISVVLLTGCSIKQGITSSGESTATPQPETGFGSETYIVPLETLATMSPEQITQLSTITVESVTVDGAIDWKLYANKLNDIMNLGQSAGTTKEEMDKAYNDGVDPAEYVSKYDPAFIAGIATPETVLDGYKAIHAGTAIAAYKGNLLGAAPIVSLSDLTDVIVKNSNETGATLDLTFHDHNNFFSSGAFNADSEKDVAQAGTNADLDTTSRGRFVAEVQDADIKLISVDKIS